MMFRIQIIVYFCTFLPVLVTGSPLRSVQGLSESANLFELIAYTIMLAYNYRLGKPAKLDHIQNFYATSQHYCSLDRLHSVQLSVVPNG